MICLSGRYHKTRLLLLQHFASVWGVSDRLAWIVERCFRLTYGLLKYILEMAAASWYTAVKDNDVYCCIFADAARTYVCFATLVGVKATCRRAT